RRYPTLCWMSGCSKIVTFGNAAGVETAGDADAWLIRHSVHSGDAPRGAGAPPAAQPHEAPMNITPADRAAIDAAHAQALKSLAEGGIPIGAALMDANGVIVALGHNRRAQDGAPTAHAETVCIRNAGRRRDWHALTMATTLSPCAMCSGTAVLHRIPRVIIGENRTFQ